MQASVEAAMKKLNIKPPGPPPGMGGKMNGGPVGGMGNGGPPNGGMMPPMPSSNQMNGK